MDEKKLNENALALKEKVSRAEKLTFLEEQEYCRYEFDKTFNIDNLSDSYCNNYKFMFLLKRYHTDLSFSSNDYVEINLNADIVKVNEFNLNYKVEPFDEIKYYQNQAERLKIGLLKYIDIDTIKKERLLLEKYAEEWDMVISKKKHKNQHLQRVCKHARDEKKRIEKFFIQGKMTLDEKKFKLTLNLWKTKWIYIEGNQIVEKIKAEFDFPFVLTLKGKEIYYTFDSIVHILNRHFAKQISHNKTKSFHSKFHPYEIHLTLKYLFSEFEKCDLLTKEHLVPNNPLNFKFLKKKYQIYFKKFKGIFQVDSLYPLEYESDLQKLGNYNLVQLNDEVGLYTIR